MVSLGTEMKGGLVEGGARWVVADDQIGLRRASGLCEPVVFASRCNMFAMEGSRDEGWDSQWWSLGGGLGLLTNSKGWALNGWDLATSRGLG